MKNDLRRWVSLSACLIAGLCAGFGYTWSVFMKPMADMFHWSAADVSLSFTLIMSTAAATAIFAGKAMDYIKPPNLLLVGGLFLGAGIVFIGFTRTLVQMYLAAVISGIGIGIVYPGATVTNIIRFFPDRKGMASGILSSGMGIGPVLLAPMSAIFIDNYGLMNALKILGIIIFALIAVMSRFVRTAPDNYIPDGWKLRIQKYHRQSGSVEDKDWKEMMKTPVFYIIAAIFILGAISGMMIISQASPIAQEVLKVNSVSAGAVVGYLAAGVVFGKIIWGAVSDKTGRNPVFVALFIIAAAAMIVMSKTNAYILFVAAICATGFCYGGFLSLIGPVTADTFGQKYLGINFGIMFLTIAVAAYLGPLLASYVFQSNNGDYTSAFIIAGFINAAGFVMASFFLFFSKSKKDDN